MTWYWIWIIEAFSSITGAPVSVFVKSAALDVDSESVVGVSGMYSILGSSLYYCI